MKNLSFIILFVCFMPFFGQTQTCLPDGITFGTQAEIDNFQTNYPDCTEIEGDVTIKGDFLTDVNALIVLKKIGGNCVIWQNSLTSLAGLDSLTFVGGNLWINFTNLENLNGLKNLTSIGGALTINTNPDLSDIAGLKNINPGSIVGLTISSNPLLSKCEILSVCGFLASPNGSINIHDNKSGCNSQEEVEAACPAFFIAEESLSNRLSISPNPFSYSTSLEYQLDEPAMVSLIVCNHLGQLIETLVNQHQKIGTHQVTWDTESLPAGIYFYRLQTGKQSAYGKMIIVK